ncbi:VanZ family protein [Flavisolibacter tropicus]|uniref:VanZ family protein n=1 Tax=Flavisolibacter tropicus TaxID=1492898 RepID=UPI00082DF4C9|nr:VanZ family protein [Flavisolibacter tropicus]
MIVSVKLRYTILTLYFITMCILFTLPGSAFPQSGWMGKVFFDKWVHIGLFSLFTFLICWAMQISLKRGMMTAFLAAVIYGILVEVVQDQFIPNRSFDLGDWAADIVGSFIGIWFWNLKYIKK